MKLFNFKQWQQNVLSFRNVTFATAYAGYVVCAVIYAIWIKYFNGQRKMDEEVFPEKEWLITIPVAHILAIAVYSAYQIAKKNCSANRTVSLIAGIASMDGIGAIMITYTTMKIALIFLLFAGFVLITAFAAASFVISGTVFTCFQCTTISEDDDCSQAQEHVCSKQDDGVLFRLI